MLHVCVHGAGWNAVHPLRWIADSVKAIRQEEQFDWDRLAAMARRGHFVAPITDALALMKAELGVPVPAETLRDLAATPVPRAERRSFEVTARPPSWHRSAAMIWWFWELHRAQSKLRGERFGPVGFIRRLQEFYGLDSLWEVPGHALGRVFRRRD